MAIQGVITDVGVQKSIDAANNEGFNIRPKSFSVSNIAGALSVSRTSDNSGVFFSSPISSFVVIDENTIKFICTVTPGQIPSGTTRNISEIALFAEDQNNNEFLFALGQPQPAITYEPSGSVTLELEVSIVNIDLSDQFVFEFTQATELGEHEDSFTPHLPLQAEMARAGQFVPGGPFSFEYTGQDFDKDVIFDGVKASATYGGITFTAKFPGPEGNNITLVFDGQDTVDEVVLAWNNANPYNPVEHNGLGTEVLTANPGLVLSSGSLNVDQNDVVYKDTDSVYKQALADGTIRAKAAGVADIDPDRTGRRVISSGFIGITTGFDIGSELFLSDTNPGKITDSATAVKVGLQTDTDFILFSAFGGGTPGGAQTFDAVVTDIGGFGFYPTTQQAIDAVSDGAFILVDKLEQIKSQLSLNGKSLRFVFNGFQTGWEKFPGIGEQQLIEFSSVPDAGTWRIEFDGQEGPDLTHNATAADVENVFQNDFGVNASVSGNFSMGFTVTFPLFQDFPQPTFQDPGLNEIQRFTFSNEPDDGTVTFEFNGEQTLNFPWDDNASDLEIAFEDLSNIENVTVTGGFSQGFFQIEFSGNDGLEPKNLIQVVQNDLELNGSPTIINEDLDTQTIESLTSDDFIDVGSGFTDVGQTFTTTPIAFDLEKIYFDIFNPSGATGEIRFDVFETSGGEPTGSSIATTGNIDVTTLPSSQSGLQEFALQSAVALSSTTQYAVVATNVSSNAGIRFAIDTTDPYGGGALVDSTDNQSTWSINSGSDMVFRVTGTGGNPSIPIDAIEVQNGKYPASNLSSSGSDVTISVSTTSEGEPQGPSNLLVIDSDKNVFEGLGVIQNFDGFAIDLNGHVDTKIEMFFNNNGVNLITEDLTPGVDYSVVGSIGYADDINGQLRLKEHPSNKSRVVVTGVDRETLDGTTKAFTLQNQLLDFEGAEIDFSTGEVFAPDGVTPLGLNFTPPSIQEQQWRWFSVSVVPELVTSDQETKGQILVLPATSDGASKQAANKPPLGSGIQLGAIAVQQQQNAILVERTIDNNSLEFQGPGTYQAIGTIFTADSNPVAELAAELRRVGTPGGEIFFKIYPDDGGGNPDTSTVLFENDPINNPLDINTLIGTSDTEVLVKVPNLNLTNGNDYHFVIETNQEYKNNQDGSNYIEWKVNDAAPTTDVRVFDGSWSSINFHRAVFRIETKTALEDIVQGNIRQNTLGGGSGGGIGDVLDTTNRFQIYLDDSDFELGQINSFKNSDPLLLVDEGNSTGSFGIVSGTYDLGISEIMRSVQLVDFDELEDQAGVSNIAVHSYWQIGNLDESAIHRVSRMGGLAGTFQQVNMVRNGLTDVLEGEHEFSEEKSFSDFIDQPNGASSVDLDDGTNRQVVSQPIVLSQTRDVSKVTLYLTRAGSPSGKFNLALVQDDGSGNPDLSAVLAQRGFFSVVDIGTSEEAKDIPVDLQLAATTYHAVVITDSAYKSSYSDGVDEIALSYDSDAGLSNYQTYDGSTFTTAGGDATLKHQVTEQTLILQTLEENAFANADGSLELTDGAGSQDALAQPFTVSGNRNTFKKLTFEYDKTGNPQGFLTIKLVNLDGSGNPDPSSVISSRSEDITQLSSGVNQLSFLVPENTVTSGDYAILFETDQDYKDNFSTGVDALAIRADTSAPLDLGILEAKSFDGTSWSDVTDTAFVFLIEGRQLELILEIESTISDARMKGFGVAYGQKTGKVVADSLPIAYTTVQPTTQEVRVNLSALAPLDNNYLKAFIQDGSGQVYMHPEFEIDGDEVVFPAGVFDVPNAVPIRFEQFTPGLKEVNPSLINTMKENFLGSSISGLDFSFPGRGVKLRADDGTLVELQVTEGPTRTIRIVDQE